MITISLKEQLSPQKNAENLYRKSKNQQIEINQLKSAIAHKESELLLINKEIEEIKLAEDVKSIKKLSKKNKPASYNQVEVRVPYKRFETNGFVILVGKGARENDELTLKYAKKEDMWLHAKDVTGSHVILKHQSNKNFPMEVIEKAAQLAAYYSKRKTDSLVPVITTQKKYVRKPKGLPPGKVHIDKEETILVSPDTWWT
jgi:predicted ribosome quality control (RQC) complex YloA/Tae2 family protein